MTISTDLHRFPLMVDNVEVKNYLSYLASVLGGRRFLSSPSIGTVTTVAEASLPVSLAVSPATSLVFVLDFDINSSTSECDLFLRMLKAMGKELDEVQIFILGSAGCDTPEKLFERLTELECKLIVSMVPELQLFENQLSGKNPNQYGQWVHWNGKQVMPVESPRELLKSPQKKRQAWQNLKNVMAELK